MSEFQLRDTQEEKKKTRKRNCYNSFVFKVLLMKRNKNKSAALKGYKFLFKFFQEFSFLNKQ